MSPSALSALAAEQNHLLAQIFAPQLLAPSRGLQAYRAHAQASAQRALLAVYPALAKLLGLDNFSFLARDFWHQHPPQRADLAQWGDAMASFIAAAPQLQELAYLPDVARIEWALHVCASAQDAELDKASFALLNKLAPEAVGLQMAPGACVLHSAYPAACVCLSQTGNGTLQEAAAMLHAGTAQSALVWRQGFAPCLAALPAREINFVSTLCQGASLAGALDLADAAFDLSAWLPTAVQNGLVLGALSLALPPSLKN